MVFMAALMPALWVVVEIGCVYMLTVLPSYGQTLYFRKKKRWAFGSLPLISRGHVALISMLALILSPSNDRYRVHTDNPIPYFLIPLKAPEFAFSFIVDSIRSLPLPHLILSLFFLILHI
jgi:hypothetical protein